MFSYVRLVSVFFNDTATTEIYTLSLHDALPISRELRGECRRRGVGRGRLHGPHLLRRPPGVPAAAPARGRSEEHTSELQSRLHLVCRLLLEKKKKKLNKQYPYHKHYHALLDLHP